MNMFYGRSRNYDDLFSRFFSEPVYAKTSYFLDNGKEEETYEVNHTKDGGYLFFNTPGFNKSNLKVELEDGVLHINGNRTYKLNGEEVEKTIDKKFTIGKEYDTSSIEATIEDGILTVFVPNFKKKEKKKISLL